MRHIYEALSQLKLVEAKEDFNNLIKAVGTELAQQFKEEKQRFPAPYNNIYYWIKKDGTGNWVEKEEGALQNYIDNFKSNTQQAQEIKDEGVDVIYKDNNWKVMKINTYEASAKYGAMTRWCICGTRTYKSGRTGRDYFDQYRNQYGVGIYFYISKQYGKYALVDARNGWCQIFDSEDNTVDDIPNKPSIPQLDNLKRILLDRVYEDDNWIVDATRNREFRGQYIVANKGDEEDAYKYMAPYRTFMTPSGDYLSIDDFCDGDVLHQEIWENFLSGV